MKLHFRLIRVYPALIRYKLLLQISPHRVNQR
jgi:hypothetical protein